jgi:RHS repeat-associated protein
MTNRDAAGGTVLSTFTYTRRVDGQITNVSETVNQPTGSPVVTTNAYTYDALNRLTREVVDTSTVGGDYTTDYTLDLVGNRVKKLTTKPESNTNERTDATFDARDRLLQEQLFNAATGGTLQDTITYGYDANGSLTSRQTAPLVGSAQKTDETWDLRGRQSGATVSTWNGTIWVVQTTAGYKYTADGIRSSVTENAVTTMYAIDAMSPSGYAQVIDELVGTTLVASYVYGAGLDPISMNRDTNGSPLSLESSLFLADGHSGVRQAVNAIGGAILAAYRFDAFGNKMATAGTLVNPIGYRGERFDSTLGQYYLRARFYDPRSGRFTRLDPFDGERRIPMSFHKYGYSSVNPVNNSDPSGRFWGAGSFLSGAWGQIKSAINAGAVFAAKSYAQITLFFSTAWWSLRQGWHHFTNFLANAGNWIPRIPWERLRQSQQAAGRAAPTETDAARQGFTSHDKLIEFWRRTIGGWSANGSKTKPTDLHVHEFVERGGVNATRFSAQALYSPANSSPIPSAYHRPVTDFFGTAPRNLPQLASEPRLASFSRLRDYVSGLNWEAQWRWGWSVYSHVIEHGSLTTFNPRTLGLLP